MFSIEEILDLAVRIEHNGETFYRESMEAVADASLKSVFRLLADQEREHREWLSNLKEGIGEAGENPEVEELGSTILQDILGEQTFSLGDADMTRIRGAEDLIGLAIEFEKDTILFYEMIGSLVEKVDASGKLREIIKEEKEHIRNLEDLRSNLARSPG